MKNWYVVYTQPNGENLADLHLQRQGFEVYLPRYLKQRRHARRTDVVARPLFPRYLFVRADIAAGQRPGVNNAPGVAYLVSVGDQPAAVSGSVIDEIKAREGDDGFIRLGRHQRFSQGDPVKISDGALCDHIGLFHSVTDNERVIILLDLLGRQTRVKVQLDSLVSSEF